MRTFSREKREYTHSKVKPAFGQHGLPDAVCANRGKKERKFFYFKFNRFILTHGMTAVIELKVGDDLPNLANSALPVNYCVNGDGDISVRSDYAPE